ncbi:hypothetical protein KVT40_003516 [Elsinoe batatas]|uniref:Uncharacterized protein n=1 Tax=Elsinoe batatas TaxID=2601811 RepID=A0A8K0L4D3_9PEZI|nr:hypothetical protein KVT40_003516 [Elsinoe batatas]
MSKGRLKPPCQLAGFDATPMTRLVHLSAVVWIGTLAASALAEGGSSIVSVTSEGSTMNNTISAYCDSVLQNFFSTYVATELAITLVPGYEGYGPTDSNGVLTGPVTSQSHWTSTYTYTQYPIRAYTAKPPCCSQCYLSAGTMQLIYWPHQQRATEPTGLPSTYTNNNGFTFTSPSVYMAFSKLYASNKCGTVGTVWQNTTLAFNADEITTLNPTITSTLVETRTVGNATRTITNYVTSKPADARINYDDLTGDCSITGGYYSYWPGNPFNAGMGAYVKDPCRPILKIPDRLVSAQPEWAASGCQEDPGSQGFYDPPITLDTAKVFAKPTFASTTGDSASSSAQPAQTATTTERASPTRTVAASSLASTSNSAEAQTGSASRSKSLESVLMLLLVGCAAVLYVFG